MKHRIGNVGMGRKGGTPDYAAGIDRIGVHRLQVFQSMRGASHSDVRRINSHFLQAVARSRGANNPGLYFHGSGSAGIES